MTQHNRDPSRNQQGQEVVLLHTHLITLGFTISTTEILNELFGPTNQQAVIRFQQGERLSPTGVADAGQRFVALATKTTSCQLSLNNERHLAYDSHYFRTDAY